MLSFISSIVACCFFIFCSSSRLSFCCALVSFTSNSCSVTYLLLYSNDVLWRSFISLLPWFVNCKKVAWINYPHFIITWFLEWYNYKLLQRFFGHWCSISLLLLCSTSNPTETTASPKMALPKNFPSIMKLWFLKCVVKCSPFQM